MQCVDIELCSCRPSSRSCWPEQTLLHFLEGNATPRPSQILPVLCACRARSQDDARDTFKTLKNQHIGDASAHLYYEWAVLEHSTGNVSKALGIIAKGMRAEAQPARWALHGKGVWGFTLK
jgi:hypothetical protein